MTLQIFEYILSAITAIGGWETIRYFINRKTNARKEEAEADNVEFSVLREAVNFLQEQLRDKEQRFAEQTERLRSLNNEVLEITKEKARLELEIQRYKCVVKGCANREPQNNY